MDERTLIDHHDVEIFTRWWPTGGRRGTVLVSHGASEHSGRYDRFARALNAAGFGVAALDHRGHGRTAASTGRGVMGPGGESAVIDDLHLLRTEAGSAIGEAAPVFLFGHSMGSLIALAYLTEHADGLAGAVLCGVPAGVDDVASLSALLEGFASADMRAEPATDLVRHDHDFEPGRTSFDWLSRDADEVDRYVADPMCGAGNPLTYGYLLDLFEVVAPARDRLSEVTCPVLVIAGDHDPAAAMGVHATALAGALTDADVEVDLTLYEGARHELLNETNRDQITADIIEWLGQHN